VNDFPKKLDAIRTALGMDRTLVTQMIEANSDLQRSFFFTEAIFHRLIVIISMVIPVPFTILIVIISNVITVPVVIFIVITVPVVISIVITVPFTMISVIISIVKTVPVAISIVMTVLFTILIVGIFIGITVPVVMLIVITVLFTILIVIISIVTNLRPPDRPLDRFDFNSADPRLARRRRGSARPVITRRRFPPS
jgi:hypothetical protein